MDENPFGDYQPKNTPDTIFDFLGQKAFDLLDMVNLPDAEPENVRMILGMFLDYKEKARKRPGEFRDGNMILGAPPKEYIPSDEECLLAEVGNVLLCAVDGADPGALERALGDYDGPAEVEFEPIEYSHADVMGSGRFFYAHKGKPVKINLKTGEITWPDLDLDISL